MGNIFLSYRREDTAGHAGRLFDYLKGHFGKDRVFMDISGIEAGMDFVEVIDRNLKSCGAFLVMIGREWLHCQDASGQRRLDNPDDFIRLEVATALKRNIRVIPVLVEDAKMPSSPELPEDLASLSRRQAIELSDARWGFDCHQLMAVLEKHVGAPQRKPEALRSEPPASASRTFNIKAVVGLVLLLLVVAGVAGGELDADTILGGLLLAGVALILGLFAWFNTREGRQKGRLLAVVDVVLAGVLMLGLIGEGLQVASEPPVPQPVHTSPPVDQPVMPLANVPAGIAGTWYSPDGLLYVIEQSGSNVSVSGLNAAGLPVMSGQGMIQHGVVRINYRLVDMTSGTAQLQLSSDGRRMEGTYTNIVTGQSGFLALSR